MALLTIENNALRLDGQPFYLVSGDFHYFRCLPGGWQRRLRLMKAFGLNTVQTYVPWNLHEPEKGRFCFDGHLNLKAFLALCQQEGLYVLLRPSPYICSECDFGGLPAWLLREPDTCVRTCDERYLAHLEDYNRRLCRESNTIDVLELYCDGAAPAFRFQDHAELDSISENAELILAPRA